MRLRFRVWGLGCWSLEIGVWGFGVLGSRILGLENGVWGFWVWGFGFGGLGVWGLVSRASGFRLRISGEE